MPTMTKELADKLWQLKNLDNQYSELRQELQAWLEEACDGYLAGWLRASLEKGEAFTLVALKASLDRPQFGSANEDNIALWHQLNEVKRLISVYELRANQTWVQNK